MEEMSPAIAVTLSLGNSGCDNPRVANQVEITRLKLVTDAVTLFSNPATPRKNEIDTDAIIQECEEDESLSPVDEATGINPEEFLVLDSNTGSALPTPVEIINTGNGRTVEKAINLDSTVVKESTIIFQLPGEGKSVVGGTKSVFELEWIPLWGSVCIQGRRPEMEDAVSAVPWSVKIPMQMLISHHAVDKMGCSLSHLRGHFFGVYDGHGGLQVANYCRDRIHLALAEDLGMVKNDCADGSNGTNCQLQWEMAFTSCFAKVDDEVAGKVNRGITMNDGEVSDAISEPVASETVGSTAIVALICSSHLIIASCGDSRAVLCRGKAAMALSVDHKPNREDEYARIEASGGKVIQWNGHRVFGVLAMSRSIGDRYLKPWIIPEPEVTLLPRAREDECLVLASDGLWDVMTNEEVCEVARRRILLWHKKNGPTSPAERGKGVDPAAQAAAEYLSALALQRGSKDNISVIVVDLKAQRKFKNKTR